MHTGLLMPRFDTFRSLPKPLLGLFLICGALLLGSVPQGAAAAQQGSELSLKLDRDMVPILGTQAQNPDALTSSRHASELQSRLLKLRDQITTLDQANVEGARQLSEREQFVDEIKTLVSKQEKLIASLGEEIRRPAARVSVAPVAMPRVTPSPAPAAATSSSPIRLGPIELPAGLENWLLEGALGVVIVLLLVMTLHLRAYAKSKDAELAELADFATRERGAPAAAQVEAPAGDEDRTDIDARIEDVSVDSRPAVKASPSKPEAAPPPPKPKAAPPPNSEAVPAMPKGETAPSLSVQPVPPPKGKAATAAPQEDAPKVASAMGQMEETLVATAAGDVASPRSGDAAAKARGGTDWSATMLSRKAADKGALKEVDTLIAFEDYKNAKLLLLEVMKDNPGNPEYRLRLLHLEATAGDKRKAELEMEILSRMMEGPMSDTIYRIKEIGRGLMPGNPLFDDADTLNEAQLILDEYDLKAEDEQVKTADLQDDAESVDFFNLISGEIESTKRRPGGGDEGPKKPE